MYVLNDAHGTRTPIEVSLPGVTHDMIFWTSNIGNAKGFSNALLLFVVSKSLLPLDVWLLKQKWVHNKPLVIKLVILILMNAKINIWWLNSIYFTVQILYCYCILSCRTHGASHHFVVCTSVVPLYSQDGTVRNSKHLLYNDQLILRFARCRKITI